MSLLIVLLAALPTSSFFLTPYLTKIIVNNDHTEAQLNFAIKQGNITALNSAWQQSLLYSEQWLLLAKKLAKTQGKPAYQLALYYKNKAGSEDKKTIFWYKNAIRLQYQPASIALAQYYFQDNKLTEAQALLSLLAIESIGELAVKAVILNINIAINQGDTQAVNELLHHHTDLLQTTTLGKRLLADIKIYQVQMNMNKVVHVSRSLPSCDNSIQLFATNLKHLKYLNSMLLSFKEYSISHAVCFAPIRYMPIHAIDCSNNPNAAIICDELNWQLWAKTINTRYVGLMLPKGGANVHLGILYIDAQDTVDIFAHEITHLLGFVDEYALPSEHITCQAAQEKIFSPNIAVLKKRYQGNKEDIRYRILKQLAWAKYIKNTTPILHAVTTAEGEKFWELGTPDSFAGEVGLFYAKTCSLSSAKLDDEFSAFKGVLQRTKLQYFSLKFPALYEKLVSENLTEYRMPSFHYNIALAHSQKTEIKNNNIQQFDYWIEQAVKWESNIEKYKK